MKKLLLSIFAILVIIPSLNRASAQIDEDFRFGVHAGAYIGANALTAGAYGTYGLDDILKPYSFLDIYCDFQVILEIASFWHVYPIIGISIHDIDTPTRPLDQMNPLLVESGLTMLDGWAPGVNFGLGVYYDLSYRWRVSGQIKMLNRLPQGVHKNSLLMLCGIDYNF